MKILLINGCEKEHLLGQQTTQKLCDRLAQNSHTYSQVILNTLSLKPCLSCDSCQLKKPGTCVINDGLNNILKQYMASDLVIIITPIVFGSCNTLTKAFLDRTQPLYMPYQKLSSNVMAPRYANYPDIKFIGIADHSSDIGIENFKNTLLNSTLALQSKHREAYIVHTLSDLQYISL